MSARVKICQISYVNFETIIRFLYSRFLWIKGTHQNPNFQTALMKICHIPHVIFQTTSQLKVMLDKSVNNVLGEEM